jgi:hypothetical protein
VIEGPPARIELLFEKIRRDDRHLGVTTFLTAGSQAAASRLVNGLSARARAGRFDSFSGCARHLTREVADTDLKQQIRRFAQLMIIDQPAAAGRVEMAS